MELILTRSYYENGTNGELQCNGKKLCETIERSWENNRPCFSCIPEGRYRLEKRHSLHHNDHLIVCNVPGRSLILIHPANNAHKQLLGCIAPVTETTGEGEGIGSKKATELLYRHVARRIDREKVWLVITSETGEPVVPDWPDLKQAS